jgi:HPt (histidine-containing phosphotransfer) domain-containing protein
LQAGQADAFRRAAHSLKSNSHTFGALGLGTLARDLELQGIGADGASNDARVAALHAEYLRVAAALRELTGG